MTVKEQLTALIDWLIAAAARGSDVAAARQALLVALGIADDDPPSAGPRVVWVGEDHEPVRGGETIRLTGKAVVVP